MIAIPTRAAPALRPSRRRVAPISPKSQRCEGTSSTWIGSPSAIGRGSQPGQPALEEAALRVVVGQGQGAADPLASSLRPPQPAQQLAARGVQVAVLVELERLED